MLRCISRTIQTYYAKVQRSSCFGFALDLFLFAAMNLSRSFFIINQDHPSEFSQCLSFGDSHKKGSKSSFHFMNYKVDSLPSGGVMPTTPRESVALDDFGEASCLLPTERVNTRLFANLEPHLSLAIFPFLQQHFRRYRLPNLSSPQQRKSITENGPRHNVRTNSPHQVHRQMR